MFTKDNIKQFLGFGIVGISNVVAAYIAYLILLKLTGVLFWANFAGYVFSTINSFLWNNVWVFKKKDDEERNPWIALLKMFMMYAFTGIVLNYILLLLWINVLGISEVIAPMINSLLGIPINFLISKLWCFKSWWNIKKIGISLFFHQILLL